jgi:2-keto-4-pentenoate hydratase/2-oxohepta-3-ene-1,7-dioic acid hydratase in catechol pathway
MKVARVRLNGLDGPETRIVVLDSTGGYAIDVRRSEIARNLRAGMSSEAARRLARAYVPSSLTRGLEAGELFTTALRSAESDTSGDHALALDGLVFDCPADPPSYRDFMAFEEHFVTGMARIGRTPDPVLYEMPVSYMGNVQAFLAHEEVMPWPSYSDHLDYELELGIVVGRPGRDIPVDGALGHVFGITVLNDFSARDIQVREMAGGLGPSKAKHFATALGPWISTLDEIDINDLKMVALVNGDIWGENSSGTIMWSIPELVAWASASEPLPAGAVLGSGTVGGGSAIETGRRLHPGDVVELEIAGIGTLRNRVGAHPGRGWYPESKISLANR